MKNLSSENKCRVDSSTAGWILARVLAMAADAGELTGHVNNLQLKLVKKLPPNCTNSMPFLTFETKGYASAVIQDIPISRPLSRAQLLELQTALDDAQDLPKTLVGVSELERLQSFVERMKQLGDVMRVQIGRTGELGLKISSSLVTLGAEFKRLMVVGEDSEEDELNVLVSMKHFAKCLQCHLAKPDCAFYGVGSQGGSLTVVFQFFMPGSRQTDKSVSLHCRLPVLDPGS